jgi:cysteine sulfinate desulfinase/cysteine desulfurase-like protein
VQQIQYIKPTIVSLMLANNEIRNINSVVEVAHATHDVGGPLHGRNAGVGQDSN